MEEYYITAQEASKILRLSLGKTYEIFRDMNRELKAGGYITVSGRVPRAFFNTKLFGSQVVRN